METGREGSAGSIVYVSLLTSVAALGGLLFGYDTAVIAGAIGYLKQHFSLNEVQEGWAVASVLVGCMIGAAIAGPVSDWAGRKKALIFSALLFAVSAIGSAVPLRLWHLVVARLVGGLGVGMASLVSPLYIAEVAPARIRGRLVSLNQIAIITGMLIVSIVNWWIASPVDTSWNVSMGWRWMFGSETLPAVLFFVLLLPVPESPRWLAKQDRKEEAEQLLVRLNGPRQARAAMVEIEEALALESGSLKDLLLPGMRVVLVIAVILAVLQQVTGINAVVYYAPKVFKTAGYQVTDTQALLQTVALQTVNLLFTLIAVRLVDRAGRRPLLLITSAAMGISLALLGGAFHWGLRPEWVFAFTLAYIASFAVAMGPVVWVVLAEIFPTRIRGRAMAVATVSLWIACFAVAQSVPWMFENLGKDVSFWTYGVMCGVAFVFILRFIPETKGKTLEQIERTWFAAGREPH